MISSGRLAVQQLLYHELGVANAARQLLTAAEFLQQRELVGAEVSLLINVGHCSHQRTQDELGVVLAGVNENSVSAFLHRVLWKNQTQCDRLKQKKLLVSSSSVIKLCPTWKKLI